MNGKDLAKDINVNITYKLTNPDAKITHTVNYVDANNIVGTQNFTGKLETKATENIKAPDKWTFVSDDGKVAGNTGTLDINFGTKDSSQNIKVTHKIDTKTEDKTVTETINLTAPEGSYFEDKNGRHLTTQSIPVQLHVTKTSTTDEVTGKPVNVEWKSNTVDENKQPITEFPAYTLPKFNGYTAQTKQGTIKDGQLSSFPLLQDGQPVKDFNVNITYKLTNPDAKITHTVNYVDADNNVVGKQDFTGKPQTKATETITAPDKWTFVSDDGKVAGNTGTLDINFGTKDSSQNIKVTHKIDTKTEDKTVTETINLTAPEGGYFEDKDGQHVTTQSIPVQLHVVRTNTTDEVTNKTVNGEWKPNTVDENKQPITEFLAYTLPKFNGYTAQTEQGTIEDSQLSSFPLLQDGQPVKDFKVNITYQSTNPDQPDNPGDHGDKPDQPTKADVKVTIHYLDQDSNNQAVANGDQVETGKAGDKINWQFNKDGKVELTVPAHYVLGDNKSNPDWSKIPDTFSDKDQSLNVYVKHVQSAVSAADHEADPNFHGEITRTITNNLLGQKPQIIVDRVDYSRNGVKDEVTGVIAYGDWKLSSVDSAGKPVDGFRELNFSTKGYQVTITNGQSNKIAGTILPAEKITPDSKNEVYTVNCTAQTKPGEVVIDPSEVGKAATLTIQYKDSDNGGANVSTKTFNGKVGDEINWPMQDGYVSLTTPEHYVLDSTKTNSYPTKFAKTSQTIDVYLKHKIDQVSGGDHKDNADLYQKVTRTINITQPGQTKPTPGSQSVEYYRIKKHDEVTGKDAYTPWTSMSVSAKDGKTPVTNYGEYALPVHDGYVEIATENGKQLKVTNHKLQAEASLVNGQPINRTVDVIYQANSTKPDQPDNPGDHKGDHGNKPDTPESKQLNWQDHQTDRNFYRVITRTVVYKMPNAATQDSTDYVIFYRNGEQDANGKITYDKWQAAKDKTGQVKDSFSAVKVPEVAGYKAVITDQAGQKLDAIPKLAVTPDTKDQKLVVTYDAVKQHFVMNYIDNADPTHLVATQTITGDPGQKVDFKMNVPENWKLAPNQGEYHTITFGNTDSKPVNIKVVHNTTQVTGNVDGNHDQDVYREIIRVFNVLYPKYTKPTQGSQTLDLSRTKTYDPVTKKTTYTPWTVISTKNGQRVNEFTPYTGVTVVSGYDIVSKENGKVLAVTVNGNTVAIQAESAVDEHGNPVNRVVEVSFVKQGSGQNPADQSGQEFSKTINYVDNDNHNTVIASQTVSGKNGQTVQVTLNVPEHWQTVQGGTTTSVTINILVHRLFISSIRLMKLRPALMLRIATTLISIRRLVKLFQLQMVRLLSRIFRSTELELRMK
ncbi:mucin-binding protein [Lactobacillus kefiranofaciens]|uniref:mucin-binding protein n=1 Tax=Lactobacillus kefiranofaciens TaxID=267818 RepID=UPI0006EECEF4|nr:hypothetical protein [Lactobacillus kefiranofaciens]KRM21924.1 hypothetical protein FC93_GL002296 [Lactobacillus kefiranofaciens subsp. kefiranofaciens DSM 5016 = JCM 6985]